MTDEIKNQLEVVQKRIQNIRSDSANSGILQQYIDEAGKLIAHFDNDSEAKMQEYRDALRFYLDGGADNLDKFYRCKSEVLIIISKKIRN